MTAPSKGNPVLAAMSVSAGIDAVVAVAGFTEMVAPTIAFWIVVGNLFLKVALGFYVRGQVVPLENVVVRLDDRGQEVAAKASQIQDDTPVSVVRAPQ